jgi:hypothetical protein
MASAGIGFTLGPLLGGFSASGSGPTDFFSLSCLTPSVCFLFLSQAPNDTEKPVRHSSQTLARRNYSKQSALLASPPSRQSFLFLIE